MLPPVGQMMVATDGLEEGRPEVGGALTIARPRVDGCRGRRSSSPFPCSTASETETRSRPKVGSKGLGLADAETVLARADEVIE